VKAARSKAAARKSGAFLERQFECRAMIPLLREPSGYDELDL
jgi:hypothetical protein